MDEKEKSKIQRKYNYNFMIIFDFGCWFSHRYIVECWMLSDLKFDYFVVNLFFGCVCVAFNLKGLECKSGWIKIYLAMIIKMII